MASLALDGVDRLNDRMDGLSVAFRQHEERNAEQHQRHEQRFAVLEQQVLEQQVQRRRQESEDDDADDDSDDA